MRMTSDQICEAGILLFGVKDWRESLRAELHIAYATYYKYLDNMPENYVDEIVGMLKKQRRELDILIKDICGESPA